MTTNRTRRRPSPALIVAVAALVLSLGGSAYAAAVAPPNSVRSSSIQNRTIKGVDVAFDTLGPRVIGPNAVTSSELAALFTATADSAAVTDDGTSNGGSVTHVAVTANCPDGTDLVSGGARWVDPSVVGAGNANVYVQEQYRSGAGNSWTVEGIVDFGASGSIKLQAQAYCLSEAPGTN